MNTLRYLAGPALATWLSLAPLPSAAETTEPDSKPANVPWEHCAFTHDLRGGQDNADIARTINRLGREGWELVSVANFTEDGTTTKTVYYFKRRL